MLVEFYEFQLKIALRIWRKTCATKTIELSIDNEIKPQKQRKYRNNVNVSDLF